MCANPAKRLTWRFQGCRADRYIDCAASAGGAIILSTVGVTAKQSCRVGNVVCAQSQIYRLIYTCNHLKEREV